MPKIGTFDVGDQPRITATFATAAGVLTDPTTVKFVVLIGATATTYTFGVDAAVTKTSAGVFLLTLPQLAAATSGLEIIVRANGTGAVTSSDEDHIVVNRTAFTTPLP